MGNCFVRGWGKKFSAIGFQIKSLDIVCTKFIVCPTTSDWKTNTNKNERKITWISSNSHRTGEGSEELLEVVEEVVGVRTKESLLCLRCREILCRCPYGGQLWLLHWWLSRIASFTHRGSHMSDLDSYCHHHSRWVGGLTLPLGVNVDIVGEWICRHAFR